jgi:hypothetical protein
MARDAACLKENWRVANKGGEVPGGVGNVAISGDAWSRNSLSQGVSYK